MTAKIKVSSQSDTISHFTGLNCRYDEMTCRYLDLLFCYSGTIIYSISQEICTRFCCALLCCGHAIVHNEFT